ncbi:MAG: adenylate kinase [bacterium]
MIPMRLILLAPPGAGKGTQSRILARRYDIPHIETGDMLRNAIQEDTTLGRKASRYITNGDLVPDDIMVKIVHERLEEPDCVNGFILDGFPRTVPQAEALEQGFEEWNLELDAVVFLDVSDEIIFQRLENRRVCTDCGKTYHLEVKPPSNDERCDDCGNDLARREDDTRESIQRRLEVYREKTKPLLNFYRSRDLLVEVDGEQPIEDVAESIEQEFSEAAIK